MRASLTTLAVMVCLGCSLAHGQDVARRNDQSPRLVASCQADLTGDGRSDIVLLLDTANGTELLALVSRGRGEYSTFVLSREHSGGTLSCPSGMQVRETRAGRGNGRVITAPGAYVHRVWAESSSVAYVWSTDRFLEVWTSD